MYEIKKSIEQGNPLGLYKILKQLQEVNAGLAGKVYFVECNAGNDSNDPEAGQSWDRAYKKLSFAITASNAEIANSSLGHGRGWAARNTIFIKGDACTEDLSTAPQKCDVIGVGSCDAEPRARIIGAHTFTGAAAQQGTRFFNLEFVNDASAAIFTVTTPRGIEWHDCWFTEGEGCTHAIVTDGATGTRVVIKDCIFRPRNNGTKFATSAIDISTVATYGLEITGCIIDGTIGIDIDSTTMTQAYVLNNIIVATTFCIDDESDGIIIAGNLMVTATTEAGGFDHSGAATMVGNILTSSDDTRTLPFATIAT